MTATSQTTHAPSCGRLAAAVLRAQPDGRLLNLFRDGSEPAFEEIVRRYGPALTAYAAGVTSPDRAEDIVQDAFTRAYRYLGEGRGAKVEQLKPWLYRVVRNTALNNVRDEGRHEHDELDLNFDGVEQPPQAFERRTQIAALIAGLQRLPEAQRDALVKRELEGFGHERIAADLGLSAGAVRQLIYRARRNLREGFGLLLPAPLVRYVVAGGGNELAGAGAAGASIGGATLLKGGAAVGVVAASLFVGAELKNNLGTRSATAGVEPTSMHKRDAAYEAGDHGALLAGAGQTGHSSGTDGRGAASGGSGKPGQAGDGHQGSGGDGGPRGSDSHSGSGSGLDGGGDSHSGSGGSGSSLSGSGDSGGGGGGGDGTSGSGGDLSGSGSSGSGSSGSDDTSTSSSGSGSSGSALPSPLPGSSDGSDGGMITTGD